MKHIKISLISVNNSNIKMSINSWSILSTSANVAGAIGPLVATSIALKYHWSYGFMIPGIINNQKKVTRINLF